jgi:hypothetical protein
MTRRLNTDAGSEGSDERPASGRKSPLKRRREEEAEFAGEPNVVIEMPMQLEDYDVVEAPNRETLRAGVVALIRVGWLPTGGAFAMPYLKDAGAKYCQAMIKPKVNMEVLDE